MRNRKGAALKGVLFSVLLIGALVAPASAAPKTEHCADHNAATTSKFEVNGSGGSWVEGSLQIVVSGKTVSFYDYEDGERGDPASVTFCVKASTKAYGPMTGTTYTTPRHGISYVVVYRDGGDDDGGDDDGGDDNGGDDDGGDDNGGDDNGGDDNGGDDNGGGGGGGGGGTEVEGAVFDPTASISAACIVNEELEYFYTLDNRDSTGAVDFTVNDGVPVDVTVPAGEFVDGSGSIPVEDGELVELSISVDGQELARRTLDPEVCVTEVLGEAEEKPEPEAEEPAAEEPGTEVEGEAEEIAEASAVPTRIDSGTGGLLPAGQSAGLLALMLAGLAAAGIGAASVAGRRE